MYLKTAIYKDRVTYVSSSHTLQYNDSSIPTSFSIGLCDISITQSAAPSELVCHNLQYHQYRQRNNCQCSEALKRLVCFLLREWGERVQWHHLDPLQWH